LGRGGGVGGMGEGRGGVGDWGGGGLGTADRTKPYLTNKCTLAGTPAGIPLNRGVLYIWSQTMEAWFGSCPKHVAEHRPPIAPW
jgi:hypothetical protein